MTLAEFNTHYCHGELKVMSGFNGKVLCRDFNHSKHDELGDREVLDVWAEIKVTNSVCFGNSAKPIICVYVDGAEECRKALNIKKN